MQTDYPFFLKSFDRLQTHFKEQFEDLDSQRRGSLFAEFVRRLIPLTDFGMPFDDIIANQTSHDKGVDFQAEGRNGELLCVQSKYTIKGKEEFDSIISKFQSFYAEKIDNKLPLFSSQGVSVDGEPELYFQIITLHDLAGIIERYNKSNLSSKSFYERILASGHLDIVDGKKLLEILRSAYKKSFVLPIKFELNFETDIVNWGNVYLGVVSGQEIKRLYDLYGDSLFFENIRDYIGSRENQSNVNQEIIDTIVTDPELFLSRNNGLVLKASQVYAEPLSLKKLILMEPSIVNGCQTTMCLVQSLGESSDCFVSVKVVEIEKAWDVAKTANRQNEIGKLELEIAQFLRPQRIVQPQDYVPVEVRVI